MKTIDKIDVYLNKMEYQKNIETEDLDDLGIEFDLKERLLEAKNVGGKDYDNFFKGMLKKYKIKSYKDLPKSKQKAFFDEVDKKWEAKKETD